MALKGLVIRQPWIDLILSGEKTWEMRSQATTVRGEIALIEKGSGKVVGMAELTDSLPPILPSQMPTHFSKHRIPQTLVEEPDFKWVRPWVITNARRLESPITYRHKSGAVIWVALEPDVEAAISGKSVMGAHLRPAVTVPQAKITAKDNIIAQRLIGNVTNTTNNLNIPTDATASIMRKGNKLYIDIEWDDGSPFKVGKWANWADGICVTAALVASICMLGFIVHLMIGIASTSVSALGAFKWWVPMAVSAFLAGLFDQQK